MCLMPVLVFKIRRLFSTKISKTRMDKRKDQVEILKRWNDATEVVSSFIKIYFIGHNTIHVIQQTRFSLLKESDSPIQTMNIESF